MEFSFNNFKLVNYGNKDNIYFKAKTVAKFLGYVDCDQAIRRFVWDSNKTTSENIQKFNPVKLTGSKSHIYINEAGLYQLVFRSKMPYAESFQSWVVSDVLPTIRRTGKYKIIDKSIKANITFNIQNEYDLHCQVVNFIKVHYQNILLTVANGELQNDTFEKRNKSFLTGYQSGTFDLIIMNAHKIYSGFCIEIKSPTGKGIISEEQKIMQDKYKLNGYKTLISNDYNKILIEIIEYMRGGRIVCNHCRRKFKNETTLNNHFVYFHKIN